MSFVTLLIKNLLHYKRIHILNCLIVSVAVGVIMASLSVGDSLTAFLEKKRKNATGELSHILYRPGRLFSQNLVEKMASESKKKMCPLLMLQGRASTSKGKRYTNQVQILGVNQSWSCINNLNIDANHFTINSVLANKLEVKVGDSIILRVAKSQGLPSDAVMSEGDSIEALRFVVDNIIEEKNLGSFDIYNNPKPQANAFLPLGYLQTQLKIPSQINSIIVKDYSSEGFADEMRLIKKHWTTDDLQISAKTLKNDDLLLKSDRVLFDANLSALIKKSAGESQAALTYLVNTIESSTQKTPYSMVAGIESGINKTDIVITKWLKEDLKISIGDRVTLYYFVIDGNDELVEKQKTFVVRDVIALNNIVAASHLMPDFPGLSKATSARNWSSNLPIDLKRIRDKDDDYWKEHRGTPKAYINLSVAQKMWGSRFGEVSSYQFSKNSDQIVERLMSSLDPKAVGFIFTELTAGTLGQNVDFSHLFLGFSFFLIAAALLLLVLMMTLNVQQRSSELKLFSTLGFSSNYVSRLWCAEHLTVAFNGCLLGVFALGPLFAYLVLEGLSGRWSAAVVGSDLFFQFDLMSAIAAFLSGFVIVFFTIIVALRSNAQIEKKQNKNRTPFTIYFLLFAIAFGVLLLGQFAVISESIAFYMAGTLVLMGCLNVVSLRLYKLADGEVFTLSGFALTNMKRNKKRSVIITALLASTIFIVVAVGTYRVDRRNLSEDSRSGTGGFTHISESTIGINHRLLSQGLNNSGISMVEIKRKPSENSSCLNLNKVTHPSLISIDTDVFQSRQCFGVDNWRALNTHADDAVPGIIDESSLKWIMGKSVGDEITYQDEWGQDFNVKIVAVSKNTVLQGHLLIAKEAFVKHYPSVSGSSLVLWNVPKRSAAIFHEKSNELSDYGFVAQKASEKLQEFAAIENTHLSIFQSLGGLGVILGTLGIGILLFRTVEQRRSELSLFRALGFSDAQIACYVFKEYSHIFKIAFCVGVLSAIFAVLPQIIRTDSLFPFSSIFITLVVLLLVGYGSLLLATYLACRRFS